MAFSYTNAKGKTYYLHGSTKPTKSGGTRTMYFFRGEIDERALDAVPDGYVVSETKNGLPVLKKAG